MTTIGLFEAKTKLSELCDQVAKRREPVVITRRGRPLVRIEPVGPGNGMSSSVWDARAAWEKKHGPVRAVFKAPKRARQTWRNPLEDLRWRCRTCWTLRNSEQVPARSSMAALEADLPGFRF